LLEKHGGTDGISNILPSQDHRSKWADKKKKVFEELKMLRTERHQENECRMCNDKLRVGEAQYLLENGEK
jgi:hypothetical protein